MMNQINLILVILLFSVGCDLLSSDKSDVVYKVQAEKKESVEVKPEENKPDPTKPIGESGEADKYYAFLKAEVFDKSCTRCHNPKNARRLDLTQKENIIREYSDIEYRMTEAFDMGFDYMPPKGDPVKTELIKIMQIWKERGFK